MLLFVLTLAINSPCPCHSQSLFLPQSFLVLVMIAPFLDTVCPFPCYRQSLFLSQENWTLVLATGINWACLYCLVHSQFLFLPQSVLVTVCSCSCHSQLFYASVLDLSFLTCLVHVPGTIGFYTCHDNTSPTPVPLL